MSCRWMRGDRQRSDPFIHVGMCSEEIRHVCRAGKLLLHDAEKRHHGGRIETGRFHRLQTGQISFRFVRATMAERAQRLRPADSPGQSSREITGERRHQDGPGRLFYDGAGRMPLVDMLELVSQYAGQLLGRSRYVPGDL